MLAVALYGVFPGLLSQRFVDDVAETNKDTRPGPHDPAGNSQCLLYAFSDNL